MIHNPAFQCWNTYEIFLLVHLLSAYFYFNFCSTVFCVILSKLIFFDFTVIFNVGLILNSLNINKRWKDTSSWKHSLFCISSCYHIFDYSVFYLWMSLLDFFLATLIFSLTPQAWYPQRSWVTFNILSEFLIEQISIRIHVEKGRLSLQWHSFGFQLQIHI